jgi:hypothetical protein
VNQRRRTILLSSSGSGGEVGADVWLQQFEFNAFDQRLFGGTHETARDAGEAATLWRAAAARLVADQPYTRFFNYGTVTARSDAADTLADRPSPGRAPAGNPDRSRAP